jgi:hypothetical protein
MIFSTPLQVYFSKFLANVTSAMMKKKDQRIKMTNEVRRMRK